MTFTPKYVIHIQIVPVLLVAGTLLFAGCDSNPAHGDVENSPNVLLITIDTLRADRVGYIAGEASSKTPCMDSIASKGIRFTRAYTTAPLTLPSHAALFTGLHPLQLGIHQNVPVALSPAIPTLTTHLKQKGYQTIAAISSSVLSSKTGMCQGFDEYNDPYQLYGTQKSGGRIAEETIHAAIALLEKQNRDKPVFLWVHLFDPHDPYTPPESYSREGESLYDGEVRYADEWVGRLVASWDNFCRNKDQMRVITSDHGEGLGEHGETYHGHFLFDTTLHVPLVISGSTIKPEIREDIVCLYDICPTILAYCGVNNEEHAESPAINLLSAATRDVPVLSETHYPETLSMNISRGYTIRRNDRKIVCQPNPKQFNLVKDPEELHPILTETTPLKKLLYATVKDLRAVKPQRKLMDNETVSRIMSLGYMGSPPPETGSLNAPVFPHPDWRSPSQATNLIDQAETLFRMPEDSDERLVLMEQCYELAPDNEFVIKGLGSLRCSRGEYAKAVVLFDQITPESVWQSKIFYDMTLAYAKQRRKSTALTCAELAVKRCPEQHLSYQAMALANLGSGRLDAARSNAWKAVTLAPRNKSAWNNFGLVSQIMEDYSEAYKAFSTSMEITDTNDYKCVMTFGRTCMSLKKFDEAEWAFEKALELNPDSDKAKRDLERVSRRTKTKRRKK